VVGHDSGPAWGMPWLTGVDQTGPARCGDAGRSSRRSSACWTAQQGQGQVLLVEGEPGTGKSLLLARADEEAGHCGFLLVAAAVGELSPAPFARGGQRRAGHAGERRRPPRDDGARAVGLTGLEELASAGPVLVTADDV